MVNTKFSKHYLLTLLSCFLLSHSLLASAESDNLAVDVQECIGLARVLELLAEEQENANANEKYRIAKNKFIQISDAGKIKIIRIAMSAMKSAAEIRENEKISAEELLTRYEIIFREKCELP